MNYRKNKYTPKPLPVAKDLEGMSLKSVEENNKLVETYGIDKAQK